MKLWFASLAAALALNSGNAQLLSSDAVQYGLLGAMIGGSVGGDYHCGHYHWSGENAAIGAGAGLLFGTLLGEARRQQTYAAPYAYTPAPGVNYGYAPTPTAAYGVATRRPNYAVGGTLLGAASGALIGEGTSGKPGQGAAIGAATGLVLGGLAEHSARRHEAGLASAQVTGSPAAAAAVTMPGGEDSKTVWHAASAARPQIPDAPRVPDAPTF